MDFSNIFYDNINNNKNKNNTTDWNTNCLSKKINSSPTNGYEPEWDTNKWTINKKFNNCYAYSVNDHNPSQEERNRKSIPGPDQSVYNCLNVVNGLFNDIPGIYPTRFECQCNPGHAKIFSAVSKDDNSGNDTNDFHFWRLDSDGLWSHKIGTHLPSRLDASNNNIQNPELSDRKFQSHDYSESCGFFCVPLTKKVID